MIPSPGYSQLSRPLFAPGLTGQGEVKFNIGTVVPVNPLNTGEMLLANTAYQTRNGVVGLMQQTRLTTSALKDILYSIRSLNSMVNVLDDKSNALVDMIQESYVSDKAETEISLCDMGSQALSATASLCYMIPGVGATFGTLFSYASDLVDWYGEAVKSSRRLENFNMRRTAFFDNANTRQYVDELAARICNMDDSIARLERVNEWLCLRERDMFASESWLFENAVVEEGFNFFSAVDENGVTNMNVLGILYPCVTEGDKHVKWSAIDLQANTVQSGVLRDLRNYRRESRGSLAHFMFGASRTLHIERVSSTPIFIPDPMLDQRMLELKRAMSGFSRHSVTKLCQIHAFLQLGGRTV